MNIVLVSPERDGGGIATYTWTSARALANLGHSVLVLCPADGQPGPASAEIRMPHPGEMAEHGLVAGPWQPPVGKRHLSGLFRALPFSLAVENAISRLATVPDVVEAPDWDSPGLRIAGRLPVVTRLHGHLALIRRLNGDPLRFEDWLLSKLERSVMAASTLCLANSAHLATLSARDHRLETAKIGVLPLGIDLDRFKPGPAAAARTRMHLPQGVPLVVFAGRIEARKGIWDLIRAWAIVARRHPGAVLAIAGESTGGESRELVLAKAQEAGIPPGCIRHLGWQPHDRLGDLFRASDIVTAPSAAEPFGYVLLEAMASGRPVVGAMGGGAPEIVENGGQGLLVEPGDTDGLAIALDTLLENEVLRLTLGECGRAKAILAFGAAHIAVRTVAAYELARRDFGRRSKVVAS